VLGLVCLLGLLLLVQAFKNLQHPVHTLNHQDARLFWLSAGAVVEVVVAVGAVQPQLFETGEVLAVVGHIHNGFLTLLTWELRKL
jgi:succinate dehydrogenase/fumarate reductase cytochrome b subunit